MSNALHLPPFTPETARLAGLKSVEARRQRKAERAKAALNAQTDANQAQRRCIRLWATLDDVDARISAALKGGKLDDAAKLAGIARTLRAQVDEEPANGRKHQAPASSAPPDPELPPAT